MHLGPGDQGNSNPTSQQHRSGGNQAVRRVPGSHPPFSAPGTSMERGASNEYHQQQSGLPSPTYSSNYGDADSEQSLDPASGTAYTNQSQPQSQQEVRTNNAYPATATPTSQEFSLYPNSARSGHFVGDHIRQYHPHSSNPAGTSGDPSIPHSLAAVSAPPYVSSSGYQVPYAAPPSAADMSGQHPYYPGPGRPDWGAAYGGQPVPTHPVFPASAAPPTRPSQVYSFVPIPGATQHKRPRRRYEEIERMYRCGWNQCEKAYGTLNHLNAHVTMQSHGTKRTPEEFKEIRKEWKARKKEEEAKKKRLSEDAQRQAAAAITDSQVMVTEGITPTTYATSRTVQLPPMTSYQQSQYSPAPNSASIQSPSPYSAPNSANMQGGPQYSPAPNTGNIQPGSLPPGSLSPDYSSQNNVYGSGNPPYSPYSSNWPNQHNGGQHGGQTGGHHGGQQNQ